MQGKQRRGSLERQRAPEKAGEVQAGKPAPDIYLAAARSLGVLPAECFAVEDSKNGVLSAYRAGMKVIMVPDLWGGEEETDKLLFSKCADLKAAAETILKEN